MTRLQETSLRFQLLVLFVFLTLSLICPLSIYAQQSQDPAFPDDLTYTLNGDNPADAGQISSGTAGGQIYRGEGTTWVPWGTTCLPGYTSTAGTGAYAGITYCVSPGSVSPAVDYVIGGNWSSFSGANLNNSDSAGFSEDYRQCLGCHYHQSQTSSVGTAYLLSGHKNTLRKVTPGQPWAGPDGNTYNTSDAYYQSGSTYNWTAGTVNVGSCDPLSVSLPLLGYSGLIDPTCSGGAGLYGAQNLPLYYLFGGWMYYGGNSGTGSPQLNSVFQGGFTGEQYPNGTFDCARCHATGYNFVSANSATGSADTGAPTFAGPEPTIQTSTTGTGTYTAITDAQMQRWPSDMGSGSDSSWYLSGVQCERCHIAEASYLSTSLTLGIIDHEGYTSSPNASQTMIAPNDQSSTALCMQCHREETISTASGGTITPTYPPVAQDTGYCSDLLNYSYSQCTTAGGTWIYRPIVSHAQGTEFLNSPHAEFNATLSMAAQNSPNLYLGTEVTTSANYLATVGTPEGGFFTETSGSNNGQNKGCTGCHDPHFTTVVTPSQYQANNALYYTLQGNLQTNCDGCHGDITSNILATIKHPVGPGTPFPTGTGSDVPGACVVCHMQAASPDPNNPTLGVPQSHFFRISADPNYYTFPTAAQYYGGNTALNTATDTVTGFTGAIWNDVDVACGQCHGGGQTGQNPYGIAPPNPAPPAFTRTYLANAATGMHGLDGLQPTAAKPTFTPAAGTYLTAQTVTISSATAGATICYTTNGTTPDAGAPGACSTGTALASGGTITVAATETVQALATESGYITSAAASAAYTINPALTPIFSPPAGTYTSAQTVTISSGTAGATICYAIDVVPTATNGVCGSGSTTLANGGSITVSTSETVEALATVATGYSNSAVATAAYIINTAATPTFSPAAGTYLTAQTVTISSTTPGATICYILLAGTSGEVPTAPTAGTCGYGSTTLANGGSISVSATSVLEAIATEAGYSNSGAVSGTYTIGTLTAPTFSPVAGTYSSTQTVTISSTSPGATICYILKAGTSGTAPTAPTAGTCGSGSTTLTNGGTVSVSATSVLEALATEVGYTNSAVTSGTYTINTTTAAPPSFSPAAGTYTSPQTVTISSTTAGVTICYTLTAGTSGTAPTAPTAGTCGSGSTTLTNGGTVSVSATSVLEALATKSGLTNSAVTSGSYAINPAAAPTFSPAAGSYAVTQAVEIYSSTPGATICYTVTAGTSGTVPTAPTAGTCGSGSSTLTDGATIPVSATSVVEALATESGYSNSTVTSGTYTINTAATPTFSPAAGTYYSSQAVTLSDATAGATICYTVTAGTTGVAPTAPTAGTCGSGSSTYTGPFTVSATSVVEALATSSSYINSAVATATYTITTIMTPTFSPAAGTYNSGPTVTITSGTSGATICYTLTAGTSGTAPTAPTAGTCGSGSTTLTNGGSVTVSATSVLEALATKAGLVNSLVTSGTYTITTTATAAPALSPAAGAYNLPLNVTITSNTPSATICWAISPTVPAATTPGTCSTGNTLANGGTVSVTQEETVEALATKSGLTNSSVVTALYTVTAAMPTFSPVAGTYHATQTVTISSTTSNATICYTTNGSTPAAWPPGTCSAGTALANGGTITVAASETVNALATVSGNVGIDSSVASAVYTITALPQAATPTFSLGSGIYYGSQTMTLADASSGATICYTTNGSIPSLNGSGACTIPSETYSGSFTVSAPTLIWAVAGGANYTASSLVMRVITIKALAPTISPGGGTYVGAQTVTITNNSASSGATIYYAFNAAPTTSSSHCSSPCTVTVSTSETLEAVSTFDSGLLSESSVTSAIYNITAPAPTFTPPAGTYGTPQNVTLADTASGVTICYTTNGSAPAVTSAGVCTAGTQYTSAIPVGVGVTTIEAVAGGSGLAQSRYVYATYTIK